MARCLMRVHWRLGLTTLGSQQRCSGRILVRRSYQADPAASSQRLPPLHRARRSYHANPTASSQPLPPLHRAAADGDTHLVQTLVKDHSEVDAVDRLGWTALMHAARGNHTRTAELLLTLGCNPDVRSFYGHSALEIGQFWRSADSVNLLSPIVLPAPAHRTVYFTGGPLIRASHLRTDRTLMTQIRQNDNAKFILAYKSHILLRTVTKSRGGKTKTAYTLWYLTHQDILDLAVSPQASVFLGYRPTKESENKLESPVLDHAHSDYITKGSQERAHGAIPEYGDPVFVVAISKTLLGQLLEAHSDVTHSGGLQPVMMTMTAEEAAIGAQAVGMADWLWRYQMCATCGSPTEVREAGYKRVCTKPDCVSNQRLSNTCYPRTDTSVIMAVGDMYGEHMLLVRPKGLYPNVYTCASGYLEPGEGLEDTCRRELYEETGTDVTSLSYHSSQYWPYSGVLMVGFLATAQPGPLKVDPEELEAARWFPRHEVAEALTLTHPERTMVVPPQAIAHQLIKAWMIRTYAAT